MRPLFLRGLAARRVWITYASYMIIFTRLVHASALAYAHFFTHVARNQEVIRAGTYLPTYRGTWSAAFSSGHGERASGSCRRRGPGRAREKKASDVRGCISGIREIITVYIECNLAKRMQRCIEARLRAQGRAKKCTLLIMPVTK